MSDAARRVRVTVLGGYLGAGKTTLINEVLSASARRRIAVVVNDFGAVNVDADLISSLTADTIELANGCMCCTVADGMGAVLDRLREMRPPPDHVVVEVSGVGDPAAVMAWAGHPGFRAGLIIVCVDAETIEARLRDRWVGDTVVNQLRAANVLLLTRTDLVDDETVRRVRDRLARVTPDVPVRDDRVAVAAELFSDGASATIPVAGAGHAQVHHSWSVTTSGLVDVERIIELLADLPPEVVRVKGVLRTRQSPTRRTVVHAAGARHTVTEGGRWPDGESQSRLVVIAVGDAAIGPAQRARWESALSGTD